MISRQNIGTAITGQLHELNKDQQHNPAYEQVNACINAVNIAQEQFSAAMNIPAQQRGAQFHVHQLALEQGIAYALLSLYKQPTPPPAGFLLFRKNYSVEAKAIKQLVDKLASQYFTTEQDKGTLNALMTKYSVSQRLMHQLSAMQDSGVVVAKGLDNIKSVADWHQYNGEQQNLLASVTRQTEFVIREAMVEGKQITAARKHHFSAKQEEADLVDVAVPLAGLIALSLGSAGGRRPNQLNAAPIFSRAYTDAVAMNENNKNHVWEVKLELPAENIMASYNSAEGKEKPEINEQFNADLRKRYNTGITRGEDRRETVLHAYFIEPKDKPVLAEAQGDNEKRVLVYSLDQAIKFTDYLQTHPLWMDKDEGWKLNRYQENLPFKEKVINQLCDVLDELNQGKDKRITAAITHIIAALRSDQSADMPVVIEAFNKMKQMCEQLIRLDNPPGKHRLDKCLSTMESQLQWLNNVVMNKGVAALQSGDIQQDLAAVAVEKDFQPGRLIERMANKPVTKHNVEAAYVACLKDYYLNGRPKTAAEFTKVQQEYEFLSNPFQLKAWEERGQQRLGKQKGGEIEMTHRLK